MARLLDITLDPWAGLRPADYTRLVMLDGQTHHAPEQLAGLSFTAVIDHHPLLEPEDKIPFLDVRPRYGATSTILTEYLRGADIIPSVRLATALVFGIKNDTSGFQRPALEEDVKAFQLNFPRASQPLLRKIEFSQMRLKDLDFLRQALEVYRVRRHCVYAHLTGVKSSDNLVQVADFLLKIDSVDMTVISGVNRDRLVVIMRSTALRSNAGKIAQRAFGQLGSAGGHQYMARAEIPMTALRDHLGETSEETLARFVRHGIQSPPKARKPGPAV
jgi:nanoRNase/pAp phosphatase (c-di-AMP/oligoRNAs hydrolase)